MRKNDLIARSANVWLSVQALLFLFVALSPSPVLCLRPTEEDSSITITEERMDGGRIAVKAVFRIQGRPDQVYETLRDVSGFPEFMPGTREVRILESGPGYHIASIVGEKGIFQSTSVMRRIFSEDEHRISWYQVEGQARAIDGFWVVEGENDREESLVTYQTYVDGGALVPDSIVREHIRKGIPPMVASLQKRVESGGTWKSETFLKRQKKD